MRGSEPVWLMVVLCCYGQGVEQNEEHHYPVKGLGLHIHQTLHPQETVPATGQAAKQLNNTGLLCQIQVNMYLSHIYSRLTSSRSIHSCLPGHTGRLCLNLHWLEAGVLARRKTILVPSAFLHRLGPEVVHSTNLFPHGRHPGPQHE